MHEQGLLQASSLLQASGGGVAMVPLGLCGCNLPALRWSALDLRERDFPSTDIYSSPLGTVIWRRGGGRVFALLLLLLPPALFTKQTLKSGGSPCFLETSFCLPSSPKRELQVADSTDTIFPHPFSPHEGLLSSFTFFHRPPRIISA